MTGVVERRTLVWGKNADMVRRALEERYEWPLIHALVVYAKRAVVHY